MYEYRKIVTKYERICHTYAISFSAKKPNRMFAFFRAFIYKNSYIN